MQDFKMSGSNMNELLTNMKAIKERITFAMYQQVSPHFS